MYGRGSRTFLRYRRRSGQLSGLDVYPFVPEILARLRMVGGGQVSIALGLISNTGNETASPLMTCSPSRACPTLSTPVCACLVRSRAWTNLSRLSSSVLGNAQHCLRPVVSSWERIQRSNGASVGFQVSPTQFTLYTSLRPSYRPSTLSSPFTRVPSKATPARCCHTCPIPRRFDLGATD